MDDLSEFSAGVLLVDFEFRPENGREGKESARVWRRQ